MLQFKGKQAGLRGRLESVQRGRKRRRGKQISEIWSLAPAEILPSAFSYYALGNEKKN